METMVAFCGLVCTDCPAFIATQKNDDEIRKSVVERWSTEDLPLTIEDVNCDGCHMIDKRLIKFCHTCEVRACGLKHKVENCGYCDEYPCERLNKLWDFLGAGKEAKALLDEIRKSLR
jgi:hypothetical protein